MPLKIDPGIKFKVRHISSTHRHSVKFHPNKAKGRENIHWIRIFLESQVKFLQWHWTMTLKIIQGHCKPFTTQECNKWSRTNGEKYAPKRGFLTLSVFLEKWLKNTFPSLLTGTLWMKFELNLNKEIRTTNTEWTDSGNTDWSQ